MFDSLVTLLLLLFCVGVPLVVVGVAMVLFRRRRGDVHERSPDALAAFDRLVKNWLELGRLSPAVAEQVRALIAAELASVSQTPVASAPPLAAATPTVPSTTASPSVGTSAPPLRAAPSTVVLADSGALPPAPPRPLPSAAGSPIPAAAALPSPAPVGPSRPALQAALLSVGTRRSLLYLGAFLLIISALTLVVFNWASFPPLIQLGILAGVTAGLWGGGRWMASRPDLATAGRNLEGIAALLVPVVGFATARPGLLDLPVRQAWLLASALSLVVYAIAAARSRRSFYSGAASLAALSALAAALDGLRLVWYPPPLAALSGVLLLLGWRLRRSSATSLANGPWWVGQISLPLWLAMAAALYPLDVADVGALAVALGVGAVPYGWLAWRERDQRYAWAAATLAAFALTFASDALNLSGPFQAALLALFALGYLALGVALERSARVFALPWLVLAPLLGLRALVAADSNAAIAGAYPLLIGGLLALPVLMRRGRLAWLAGNAVTVSGACIVMAGLLGLPWVTALAGLAKLSEGTLGLLVLGLSAALLVGAHWWPGRLARHYDWSLHALGALYSTYAVFWLIFERPLWLIGTMLLALVWGAQAALRRSTIWATVALLVFALVPFVALDRLAPPNSLEVSILIALGLCYSYALGGTALRRGPLAYWTWPALGWSICFGLLTGALVLTHLPPGLAAEPLDVSAILALGALLVLLTRTWQQPLLGFGATPLLLLGIAMAAAQGFFTSWSPELNQHGLVACAVALGFGLAGWALRRRLGAGYALPYEVAALAALVFAPLPPLIGDSSVQGCLTWSAMALLLALAGLAYRVAWPVAPALLSLDVALVYGTRWLLPNTELFQSAWVLVAAVAAQSLSALAARRGTLTPLGQLAARSAYFAAGVGALSALLLASENASTLAWVCLALAGLAALLATVERNEPLAWTSLALGLIGAGLLHIERGVAEEWTAAWMVLELLGVTLAGWLVRRLGLSVWTRPSGLGALGAALALTGLTLLGGALPPVTFALASLGLLLATLAVRERQLWYGYAAGAAFVAAGLCQLADWGFREPQWYVLPAGLYLLGLAAYLRRFQGQARVSQLVETAAVALMLGVTFGQALRPEGGLVYSLLLFGESLVVAAYGALARLRVPFVGGIAFFVAGVSWMTVDTVRLVNQWVLLGALGLLMVAAYVILERHQERLVRTGRSWAAQLRSWG